MSRESEAIRLASIITIIRGHNLWRRGDDDMDIATPKMIGEALDAICEIAEKLDLENGELLQAVQEFCRESNWSARAWRAQPHIAKLYELAEKFEH